MYSMHLQPSVAVGLDVYAASWEEVEEDLVKLVTRFARIACRTCNLGTQQVCFQQNGLQWTWGE